MPASASSFALDRDQQLLFRALGFLGPFTLCAPDEMARHRKVIVNEVFQRDAPDHGVRHHNRHLDCRLVYDLSTDPAIIDRMASLYGPDLLMWRTNFFVKQPGDPREIPWHQDYNYWPLEPPIILSAWLAIDPATRANSCVQIIPGSHSRIAPHIPATANQAFTEQVDPRYVDAGKAVHMELQPGEFFLFNERTLHYSPANHSDQRRIGLAIRVILPIVQVTKFDSPRHKLVLVRGEDRLGLNPLVDPPAK